MRKGDIQTSYHRSGNNLPMVNVKVHNIPGTVNGWEQLALQVAGDAGDENPTAFAAYVARLWETDSGILSDHAWEVAIEQGWEALETDAQEVFGPGVTIYAEGRQGGWCVVKGLGDVDGWDAVAVAKWGRFARYAREHANAVPYGMVDYLYHNPWAVKQERAQAAREHVAARAGGV